MVTVSFAQARNLAVIFTLLVFFSPPASIPWAYFLFRIYPECDCFSLLLLPSCQSLSCVSYAASETWVLVQVPLLSVPCTAARWVRSRHFFAQNFQGFPSQNKSLSCYRGLRGLVWSGLPRFSPATLALLLVPERAEPRLLPRFLASVSPISAQRASIRVTCAARNFPVVLNWIIPLFAVCLFPSTLSPTPTRESLFFFPIPRIEPGM